VNYATTSAGGTAVAGNDYRGTSGTLSFSPGTTSMSVTVSVSGDKTAEADETFFLKLSNPINGVLSSTSATGTGTIRNDDGALATGGSLAAAAGSDTSVVEFSNGKRSSSLLDLSANQADISSRIGLDLLMESLGNGDSTATPSFGKPIRGRLQRVN
jgi:Calx-beta domain